MEQATPGRSAGLGRGAGCGSRCARCSAARAGIRRRCETGPRMCLHECVLNHVIGVGACSPQSRHPLGDRGMTMHQVREGGCVSGHRLRHQICVRNLADRLVPQHLPCPGWIGPHLLYTGALGVVRIGRTPSSYSSQRHPDSMEAQQCRNSPFSSPPSVLLWRLISTGRWQPSPPWGSPRSSRFASSSTRTSSDRAARHGLSAPTTHVSLQAGDQDETFAVALARELGIETVIDPYVDPERWQVEADIVQIDELNAAAGRAAGYGLRVGYHNHHFELESRIDGRHGSRCWPATWRRRWCSRSIRAGPMPVEPMCLPSCGAWAIGWLPCT